MQAKAVGAERRVGAAGADDGASDLGLEVPTQP